MKPLGAARNASPFSALCAVAGSCRSFWRELDLATFGNAVASSAVASTEPVILIEVFMVFSCERKSVGSPPNLSAIFLKDFAKVLRYYPQRCTLNLRRLTPTR
jgi:hypothetical protein